MIASERRRGKSEEALPHFPVCLVRRWRGKAVGGVTLPTTYCSALRLARPQLLFSPPPGSQVAKEGKERHRYHIPSASFLCLLRRVLSYLPFSLAASPVMATNTEHCILCATDEVILHTNLVCFRRGGHGSLAMVLGGEMAPGAIPSVQAYSG